MHLARRPLYAVVLTALALAVASTATGQSEEPADPAAADYWTGTWTFIEGTFVDGTLTDAESTSGAAYQQYLGARTSGEVTADDPRMAGTMTLVQNVHFATSPEPDEGDVGILNGTARIDNDAGAWVGTYTAFGAQSGGEEWYVLEGEGAYEGLSTVFRFHGEDSSYAGVIVPAELPALPDPVEPPTE